FAHLHPTGRFPDISLLVIGTIAALFCFLQLRDLIAALVVIRILIQFISQTVGLILLRVQRPEVDRPFRMPFFPIPALLSLIGFVYILFARPNFTRELRLALALLIIGIIIYLLRAWRRGEWPLNKSQSLIREKAEHLNFENSIRTRGE